MFDAGVVFWTISDIHDSIQDGYDEVATLTECIEKVTSVNFASNRTYYNFRSLIPDYFRIIAIYNNVTNRWLIPNHLREFDETSWRWETLSGSVEFFAPCGFEWLALLRKPASATSNMLVFYKATANTLIGTDIPKIPVGGATLSTVDSILENFATGDLLQQALEYGKAERYNKLYLDQLELVKTLLNSRALPDRLYELMIIGPETLVRA